MKNCCIFLLLFIAGIAYQCRTSKKTIITPLGANSETSPVIPARESIAKMKIEPGFKIKLIAAEPLVSTPVALNFDKRGCMWVVEMDNYMPDTLATGENVPSAKIVILEDKNKDGIMDTRTVFLDSLIMPRAICLIGNGVLVGEPTNLWYYDIINDKPANKTLIDDKYTEGGNVESQANGLYRAIDNWIYNAKSDKRYRKFGDKWVIEHTHSFGQWGISQDNAGRLYANHNTINLVGNYFPPSLGTNNRDQRLVAGYNEVIVPDNHVFPIHPTPGVNRGYEKGILDEKKRLISFTAGCGPVIYRGGLFGEAYEQNPFTCEPAANLVKRDILTQTGNVVKGREAYGGREFLASTDERFRPVSLYNGPDGALYIVDMYRGIIQHRTYLSSYLEREINKRGLIKPISCGRIYKVYPKNKKTINVIFPDDPLKLVSLLGNANGFVRDKAQQLLVDSKSQQVIPALHESLKITNNPLLVIHSLWTLEGLSAIKTDEVLNLLQQKQWQIRMQALTVLPSVINKNSYQQYTAALKQIIANNDTLAAPYVGFVTNYIQPFDKEAAHGLLLDLVKRYPDNLYVADAVISNLQGSEASFKAEIAASLPSNKIAINVRLNNVITSVNENKRNSDPKLILQQFPKGAVIFNTLCKTCHGPDGNGIASLAPPLNKSEIVTGSPEKVISILLKGLTGPVKVNNHLYESPEIADEMPGLSNNKEYTDTDIAQILSFVRRSWQNRSGSISEKQVSELRKRLSGRNKAFTISELDGITRKNLGVDQ